MGNTKNIYADADAAINRLRNNGIYTQNKLVEIPKTKSVGIKLWGAIDYLKNYCGYGYCRLSR
jgi:uncharacterized protein YutD